MYIVNCIFYFSLHSGTSQSFFLGNLNKRAKVVTLQIKGLANQVWIILSLCSSRKYVYLPHKRDFFLRPLHPSSCISLNCMVLQEPPSYPPPLLLHPRKFQSLRLGSMDIFRNCTLIYIPNLFTDPEPIKHCYQYIFRIVIKLKKLTCSVDPQLTKPTYVLLCSFILFAHIQHVVVPQITRKLCEEELLKVKGVISFTFVMTKSRCIIRCKVELSPEMLCDAINNTKLLSAQQVVRNERGEEVG